MTKGSFLIARHCNGKTEYEERKGWTSGYFGIHKDGHEYSIVHLLSKHAVKFHIPKLRDAQIIASEIDGEFWADVTTENYSMIPDEIRMYLTYGLRTRRGDFMMETMSEFQARTQS